MLSSEAFTKTETPDSRDAIRTATHTIPTLLDSTLGISCHEAFGPVPVAVPQHPPGSVSLGHQGLCPTQHHNTGHCNTISCGKPIFSCRHPVQPGLSWHAADWPPHHGPPRSS